MDKKAITAVVAGILGQIAALLGVSDIDPAILSSIAVALVGIGAYVIGKGKA